MSSKDEISVGSVILGFLGLVALAYLLSQKKCGYCGNNNPASNVTCNYCGRPL